MFPEINKFSITDQQYIKIHRKLDELSNTLFLGLNENKGQCILNPLLVNLALEKICDNNFNFIYDSIFKLVSSGNIIIPKDYNILTYFDNLPLEDYSNFDERIINLKYNHINPLIANKKYKIEIFELIDESVFKKKFFWGFLNNNKKLIPKSIIIDFLKKKKALFPEPQLLPLIRQLNNYLFPKMGLIFLFNSCNESIRCNDEEFIPAICRDILDEWSFVLLSIPPNEQGIPIGIYFTCLTEICDSNN